METNIIEKELKECNGYEINTRLVSFTNSLLIYQANVNALRKWYKMMNDPHVALTIWETDNYMLMENMNLEMQRLFTNFLSSAYSLRDHLYTLRNEYYKGTDVDNKMEEYIQKYFVKNNITKFIQDFRNFIIHCGYPKISKELQIDNNGIANDIWFDKKELLKFKGWKKESKQYLDTIDEKIKLITVVEEYNKILDVYYNEILKLLKKYHYEELKELRDIKDKYKLPLQIISK